MMQPTELGTVPTEKDSRDAIHVAVLPVIAKGNLHPGQFIEVYTKDKKHYARVAVQSQNSTHGICDPFRTGVIYDGVFFWAIMLPGTITDMRHHWTHACIEEEQDIVEHRIEHEAGVAEAWMRDFADDIGLSYEQVLIAGDHYSEGEIWGGYTFDHDTPDRCYEDAGLYWGAWSAIRGKPIPEDEKEDPSPPFSCAC